MSFHTHDFSELIKFQKYPLLITLGFFLITSYVSFFHHNYWTLFDQDGLIYFQAGKEILSGNGQNVQFVNAGPGGPVLYAVLDSIFHDGFFVVKLVSLLSGTGIVFVSYYIIRNIFDYKIALVGQLFVAFNPWFNVLSTHALNDLLPISLSLISLYFLTKKTWKFYDMMIIGSVIGLAFMVRYHPILVLATAIIVVLISSKTFPIKISYVITIIVFFLVLASPMFIYNYTIHENFIDSDSNYYIGTHSKYYTPEWKDETLSSIGKKGAASIFFDFDLFLKNYFYNLFFGQPTNIFGFENRINVSLIPAILIIGIFPVLGGYIYSIKMNLDKKNILTLTTSALITTFVVLIFGNFEEHFFAIIMIPLFSIWILNFKKIQKNYLPIIILPIVFAFVMAMLPLRAPQHFLIIWISIAIFSSIFFLEAIPKIIRRIIKTSHNEQPQISNNVKKIIFIVIVLVLLVNLGYSIVLFRVVTNETSFSYVDNNSLEILFNEKNQYEIEAKQIIDILKKQPNIENSYIMTKHVLFGYYANSKWVGALFNEGPENDTIENYITRKNWKEWQIFLSNINSKPMDRFDLNNPLPDYLIYVFHQGQLEYLKILADPSNPKIPSNFEVLYKSDKTGTVVYKIHKTEEEKII